MLVLELGFVLPEPADAGFWGVLWLVPLVSYLPFGNLAT